MKINKNVVITTGLYLALLGGLFYWQSKVNPLPQSDNNQGSGVTLDKFVSDFGQMGINEEKTGEFVLKNNGQKTVTLTNFETSCNCTFGRVVANGVISPTFNMRAHMAPSDFWWRQELAPGEEARIQVTYKPSVMPVYGAVERSLFFKTSDKKMPNIELKIKAFVQ